MNLTDLLKKNTKATGAEVDTGTDDNKYVTAKAMEDSSYGKNPMTTAGDVIYGGTSGVPTRLAKGTAGQVLKMNSGATAPEWADASGGGAPTVKASTCFESINRFTVAKTGTGDASVGGLGLDTLTGATAASFANIQWYIGYNTGELFAGSPIFSTRFSCTELNNASGAGHIFAGIGAPTVAGGGITFTGNHIGFKIIKTGGVSSLYATQANGTETASSALTTLTNADVLDLVLKVNGTTSVDYYWRKNGGALSAATNLTTNIPTATMSRCTIALSNVNSAYNVNIHIGCMAYER